MIAYEAYNQQTVVFCGSLERAQQYISGLAGWAIRSIEIPAPAPLVDWGRFASTCLANGAFMSGIKARAIPNEWSLALVVLQAGTSETRLLEAIQNLGVTFTNEEQTFLNQTFADCGFTIRI